MDRGSIQTFDMKTGKLIETKIDDKWVLANTREVQLIASPTTIAADGEDVARVIVLLTSGMLVSREEKQPIEESVTITLVADGARYNVALTAGMGVVSVKAVAAGSYEIGVDGIHHEALTIVAEEAKASVPDSAQVEAREDADTGAQRAAPLLAKTAEIMTDSMPEQVIVLGKRQLAEKASSLSGDVLKTLTAKEFASKSDSEKIVVLTEMVIHLARMAQDKR